VGDRAGLGLRGRRTDLRPEGDAIDAVRAGFRVGEIELDLAHRATGRSLGGFAHRGRQLRDIARAYLSRRGA